MPNISLGLKEFILLSVHQLIWLDHVVFLRNFIGMDIVLSHSSDIFALFSNSLSGIMRNIAFSHGLGMIMALLIMAIAI